MASRSITERIPGSAIAHSADTLLSTENVMSNPGERVSLPAFWFSLPEPSGANPL